ETASPISAAPISMISSTGRMNANSIAAIPSWLRAKARSHLGARRGTNDSCGGTTRIGHGSFLNAAVAIKRRLPFDRLDRLRPSGPKNTGHWYMTRITTMLPALPGLNCQVLVTLPEASKVSVGAEVTALENEP